MNSPGQAAAKWQRVNTLFCLAKIKSRRKVDISLGNHFELRVGLGVRKMLKIVSSYLYFCTFLTLLMTIDNQERRRGGLSHCENDRWRHKLNSQWLTDSIDRHSNRLWSFWKNISGTYSADGRLIQLKYGTNVFTLNREVTSPFLTHQLIDYRGSIYRNLWRIWWVPFGTCKSSGHCDQHTAAP